MIHPRFKNPNIRIVASQPVEAIFAHRLTELRDAWFTLVTIPYLPQSWFAWFSAMERLEGERLRYLHQVRR